jgi:hypothetical protein
MKKTKMKTKRGATNRTTKLQERSSNLTWLSEPRLQFAYGQEVDDPRDGLTLFGPLDEGNPYGIRAGVVGTAEGVRKFEAWVGRIQHVIANVPPDVARPLFPGFQAAFRIPWREKSTLVRYVDPEQLRHSIHIDDAHQRVFQAVDLYEKQMVAALEEDPKPDLWFVVVPDDVYLNCRPRSWIQPSERVASGYKMSSRYARERRLYGSLFPGEDELALPYHYEVDFHNQLKARLLDHRGLLTQIVRESTVAPDEYLTSSGRPKRRAMEKMASAIAWNLAAAAFYKAGGRPWKVASVRESVCYVGLAFKVDHKDPDGRSAGCGAQMFLDSGDGMVFRGALGPWFNPKRGDYHLDRGAARELATKVVRAYVERHGRPPHELFIHGRVRFHDEEWIGFREGVGPATKLVGVRIREAGDLKLFRQGKMAALRGLVHVENETTAYLWTKGFTPRLQKYPGREVPNPILVEVCRGHARLETVLNDIMALTKLNYNSCVFADGLPVTLKFADDVGEILTAGPIKGEVPLPFRHYI